MKNKSANPSTQNTITKAFIYLSIILLAGLAGCNTSSKLHCPDLISAKNPKPHEKIWTSNYHRPDHAKALKSEVQNVQPAPAKPEPAPNLSASTDNGASLQIKLPTFLTRKMGGDEQLSQMSTVLNNFSADKVSLVRKDNGRIYLTAGSAKDFVVLTQNVAKAMGPRGYYEKRYGNGGEGDREGAAIAAGVLGPVGFIFSFIPFLNLAAVPISIAAIVTGAIGMRSHRHRMAIAGLIFGVLGLFIALLTILFYHTVFAFFVL